MKLEQNKWSESALWDNVPEMSFTADLVLVFGKRQLLENTDRFDEIRSFYPAADIVLCSTAGEILDIEVFDDTIVTTAIQFEKTVIKTRQLSISDNWTSDSDLGKELATLFPQEHLSHVLLLSHGLNVNGTRLIEGMKSELNQDVSISGGLAGDGPDFVKTVVGLNATPSENKVVAVGFYGGSIKVGYGSFGGWDTFGHTRRITRSEENVLFELDGKPALDLYKNYLGEKAKDLPASGLLFPLSIKTDENASDELVRTILSVNEEEKSLTFAGDIPEGGEARLMKANFESLYEGASKAAENSISILKDKAQLALLISCVGRKLILKQHTEDEVESVREVIGEEAMMTGFYSYGELGPDRQGDSCYLHNQTMTITLFSE
ncbi:MAG: FIST C-terminal domain-containing protein [Cytophagales bacterium]|nr:FIST C-terminal domain-containing protein [Cytophagales bacterium]